MILFLQEFCTFSDWYVGRAIEALGILLEDLRMVSEPVPDSKAQDERKHKTAPTAQPGEHTPAFRGAIEHWHAGVGNAFAIRCRAST